jgi:ribosome-associated translation inhibitor RaiA
MQVPLQITFRGMDHSDAVEAMIRERAGRLERFNRDIIRCHVTVDQPHRHRTTGRAFSVHIDITTPGGSVVLTHDPSDRDHEQFAAVVRDAFDAATRQLEEEARRRRGD